MGCGWWGYTQVSDSRDSRIDTVQRNQLDEVIFGCFERKRHLGQRAEIQLTSRMTRVIHVGFAEVSAKNFSVGVAITKVLEQNSVEVGSSASLIYSSGKITVNHQDTIHC